MFFKQIKDEQLAQYAYLIGCQQTGEAIVIDPERDIRRYIDTAEKEGLSIVAAADTHIHADFLTGLREFAERGVKIYASGEGGNDWQYKWLISGGTCYNYQLLKDEDRFNIGNIAFKVLHTPGHTPEHISFLVTDGAATAEPMGLLSGDFVFVGDLGRPDLLETAAGLANTTTPAARQLFDSVQKFKKMPEYLKVWPAHGAGSICGKSLGAMPDSTVGYELRTNAAIAASDDENRFVDFILAGQPEPPLYFARMKRDNKMGPAILGGVPEPIHLDMQTIRRRSREDRSIIVDTRSPGEFMKGHLPNSILAPLDSSFPTVAGSYIRENEQIHLVCDQRDVSDVATSLIRIGLDNLSGYITPETIRLYREKGGELTKIDTINFKQAEKLTSEGAQILDVRAKTEFESGHLPGAQHIAHTRLADSLEDLDQSKLTLIHCRMGGRSAVASAYLKRMGFDVKFIDDSIIDYLNKKSSRG